MWAVFYYIASQKTYSYIGPNALVKTKSKCNNCIIKDFLRRFIMNIFSAKIKKVFCFTLSISLLFSNVNIFAQNMTLPSTRQLVKEEIWPLLVQDLEPALTETQVSFDKLVKAIQTEDVAQYQRLISEYQTNLKEASHIYSRYKSRYHAYDAFLTSEEATSEVARLARQYEKAGEELPQYFVLEEDVLFSKLRSEVTGIEKLSHAELAEKLIGAESEIPYLQENLLNHFNYKDMIDFHKIDMKAYRLDFKSANNIRKHLKPADVLEFAYQRIKTNSSASIKAGVDLNLKLHTNPEEIFSFISGIRKYTRNFRHVKVPSYLKLMKTIRGMNFAARENYLLTEVTTDLTEGNIKLIKDIEKLQTETRLPFVKKLMQSGPMIILGSAIIALTITSIAAGRDFSSSSMDPGRFAEVKTAIENNDINLTTEDVVAFYDSDRADALIASDMEHAITFANMALSEKEMENAMELWKQRKQDESTQEKETNHSSIKTSLLNNSNPGSVEQYGVGTL